MHPGTWHSRALKNTYSAKVNQVNNNRRLVTDFRFEGIMRLSTITLIIVSPVNLGLNIAFVHHTPLRLLGSPLALSITYWLAFVMLIVMTALSPHHKLNETWGGFRIREALTLKSIWTFLKLALPGILMVGTEW